MDIRKYFKDAWDGEFGYFRSKPESRASPDVRYSPTSHKAIAPKPKYESSEHNRRTRTKAMRTVSEDDELVQRAANPRTGMITPFINIASIKEDAKSDYLAAVQRCESKTPPLVRLARKAVGSGVKHRKHGLAYSPPVREEVDTSPPIKPSPSQRLSQYLPKLEFLHPSHFANLEQAYHRPTHLLPPNLRKKQHRTLSKRIVSGEKACERPPMQRRDGNENVSQAIPEEEVCDLKGKRHFRARLRSSPTCHCPICLSPGKTTKQSQNTTITGPVGLAADRDNDIDSYKALWEMDKHRDNDDIKFAKPRLPRLDTMTTWSLANTGWIQERILGMISHVFTTLHDGSPALKVLRSQDARFDEYAKALRQVFLAALYTLVLLNIFMLVARVVRLILRLLVVLGWPVKMVCFMLGWVFRA